MRSAGSLHATRHRGVNSFPLETKHISGYHHKQKGTSNFRLVSHLHLLLHDYIL